MHSFRNQALRVAKSMTFPASVAAIFRPVEIKAPHLYKCSSCPNPSMRRQNLDARRITFYEFCREIWRIATVKPGYFTPEGSAHSKSWVPSDLLVHRA